MNRLDRELFREYKSALVESNRKHGGSMVHESGFSVSTRDLELYFSTCIDPIECGEKLAKDELACSKQRKE